MSGAKPSLMSLTMRDDFARRHIGPDDAQITAMLKTLGLDSIDSLISQTVPDSILNPNPLLLPNVLTESETIDTLQQMSDRNLVYISMIGMGYYDTLLPPVIQRNVLESPGWYTAYTPYQAEVSQGRLEALLNYQQMVTDLTGMALANASLLDEATAAAEAMAMSKRVGKSRSNRYFVDQDCHPQTLSVLRTRAEPMGFEIVVGDAWQGLDEEYFGILLQYPGSSGTVRDLRPVIKQAKAGRAIVTVASDLLSLVLLKPPGEMGADIVVGSAQRFGVPMGYGGPHAAFFATVDEHKRAMPGRIIGVSIDAQGRPALRMALQTREQHIRREKATSNICTAQVLLAVIAGFYAVWHGPLGLKTIASRVHRLTQLLAAGLEAQGYTLVHKQYFDTLVVHVPGHAASLIDKAQDENINLRSMDPDHLGISLDEVTTREHVQTLWQVFSLQDQALPDLDKLDTSIETCIPPALRRETAFMTHPVFNSYHSETEMLRYLRKLAAKDIALDRAMIPLGSCTMKLNATTEMMPVTWPGFGRLHPFAPEIQTYGYWQLFIELKQLLCQITGFAAVSLQPNAGSQGEYTGLLVIRRYHQSRGENHRNICLIPSSAHGTNPASAQMVGMKVVVVKCDEEGNVDVSDLITKAEEYTDQLAALMITYPSTHGVFESAIRDICQIIHDNGGQVYMDGANLNALVGLCLPAEIGADVSHMNLHKTFCIPHGGGGPGMGPIGVKSHLAPFLPGHAVVPGVNPDADFNIPTVGPVSAAPFGSASILTISWAYIRMMGYAGLRQATQVAILNANYIAQRLSPHFPVLYKGQQGRVAHECIIDLRPVKASCGITVDDVAKRLVDYGFHAPTMSFPVADTLMIEPTESESKREIDRFCDAMISIRKEIAEVEAGTITAEDCVLRHAPHTSDLLIQDWQRAYSREQAFFPLPGQREDKYWPPVGRVDNVYGDRNLICACPPMEEWMDVAD